MPTVTIIGADGAVYELSAKPGTSLMRAAVEANVPGIDADCGGCCSCGTCHVYVDQANWATIPPAGQDEVALLELVAAPRKVNSRLSCQIELTANMGGLVVTVPPTQT